MDGVAIEQVNKSFGAVQAVRDLSVRVPGGCIYGFLGPNGAGKTTTLRMIMDIIRPDSGHVEVLGSPSVSAVKDRVSYLPEERGLYRKMRVGKVLEYFGAIKGLAGADLRARAGQWLQKIGLADWGLKRVEDLSRGMQQKLQFAVAAINEPELLVLDEPFSGLDPVNLDLLKAILLQMKEAGKTIVLSTHVMHEAEQLCDFIVLINKGQAVVNGTLEEIRRPFQSSAVCLELDGQADFLPQLPMVRSVSRNGRQIEVGLDDAAGAQELLKALAGRVAVQSFRVKVPSLHEIFVRLVGGEDA